MLFGYYISGVTSGTLSPNGEHTALGFLDRCVHIRDIKYRQLTIGPFIVNNGLVYFPAYIPDGKTNLSGSEDID